MIKKIISNLLYGKIVAKNFSFFENENNRRYSLYVNNSKIKSKQNLYILQNSRIIQSGNQSLAILSKNYFVKELSFQSDNLIRRDFSFNKVYKDGYVSFFVKKINGTSVSLLQDISQKKNYFHFLFDSISRLYWLEKLNIKYDYLLVPSLKEPFQKEILNELNIKKKIIDCSKYKVIDVKKLIVIDHPYWKINSSWEKNIKDIPAWSIKFLKKKFKNKLKYKISSKKIFIDRSNSKSPHNQIQNIKELKNLLKKYNFQIIELSKMSFRMQKNLFNNAKIIIGPHDAGFANLIFCKSKTIVLEFRNKTHHININSIGTINKLKHRVWISNIDENGKMIIDLNKLEKFLKHSNINI